MKAYAKAIGALMPLLAMADPGIYKPKEFERRLSGATVQALVDEYKLIQAKKSTLSKRQRDMVEGRIQSLIRSGIITENLEPFVRVIK